MGMVVIKDENIVLRKRTRYNLVTVTREGEVVTLWSGGVRHTEIMAGEPMLTMLEYSRLTLFVLAYNPDPCDILVLGLGGGAIPSVLSGIYPSAKIDIVDIDPEMPEIAKEYFNFSVSRNVRVFIDDAFLFMLQTRRKYDVICLDTYCADQFPRTVDNPDFLIRASGILKSGGVVAANLMSANSALFQSRLQGYREIFRDVRRLTGNASGNTLVFATQAEISHEFLLRNIALLKGKIPFWLNLEEQQERLAK